MNAEELVMLYTANCSILNPSLDDLAFRRVIAKEIVRRFTVIHESNIKEDPS